jgi:hypothetical protein
MNIELSDANYIEIVGGLIGVALVVAGNGMSAKRKKIITTGIKVEGVVFALEEETSNFGGNRRTLYSPVIRFITIDKEWVTEKYMFGISSKHAVINPSYKEEDKVNVIYDPKNIKDFVIDDFNAKAIGPLCVVIGTLAIIGSILYFVYQSGFNF